MPGAACLSLMLPCRRSGRIGFWWADSLDWILPAASADPLTFLVALFPFDPGLLKIHRQTSGHFVRRPETGNWNYELGSFVALSIFCSLCSPRIYIRAYPVGRRKMMILKRSMVLKQILVEP